MLFSMREPYYGILLSAMERYPSKNIDTIGVTQSGNVFRLVYNPDFITPLPDATVLEILKHEVLHLAFNHFTLWEDEKESSHEQQLRNIAADLEVNCYIDVSQLGTLPALIPSKYGWRPQLGAREYYRLLKERELKNSAEKKASQNKQCGGSGDEDTEQEQQEDVIDSEQKEPETFDDHSKWPDGDTEQEVETLKQQVEDLLVAAAEEVERSCGTVPGEMTDIIQTIRDRKKPKPVTNWKRYCRRYLGNAFSEMLRKSNKRRSKRFPDAAGTRKQRKSLILVAIDTSGSVSIQEYLEFFGQLKTLHDHADFHVVECDAAIQHEYDYRGRPNLKLHGMGGTSFQPVIDMYRQNIKKYDALVYFTDGYAAIPSNTPKETLWVISSTGDQSDRNKYMVNGCSAVFIPKKQQ